MRFENIFSSPCDWSQRRFSEYLDGVLPEDERIGVHEHVKSCAACSFELDKLCGSLRRLAEYDKETLPASIQTYRVPRSTFIEVFPTIRDDRPTFTYGILVPYLSALVLFFMVITTWITIEKHLDTEYNESNYVEVYGN
jgi:hypothetical protein